MGYKVLIPTAGTGSRLGNMTKFLNKSLISIGNKPTIAHIIDMFPEDTEFVIPIGYKGNLVKEFLKLAYPKKKFYFAEVLPFEGEGSGLGLSILTCKEYLQEPFIFCSCDTLVKEKIPYPTYNWMGYGERTNIEHYRTIDLQDNHVIEICEKGEGPKDSKPYIGLAGVYDYKLFWETMENNKKTSIIIGESYGLKILLQNGMDAIRFTWYDTGVKEELELTREAYKKDNAPNILEKENETIWFMEDKVIKFSDDTKFISDRVKRAEFIKNYIPNIIEYTDHMYAYSYANGKVLSEVVSLPIFEQLLDFSKEFWKKKELSSEERKNFNKVCMKFYKDKTYERVNLFYSNFSKKDSNEKINGLEVPTIKDMFEKLDWDWIADGMPGQFHGDYHFENILYDNSNKNFVFLDWRQNFGGALETGDIYYDLAKMMHGLIICHELIAKDEYWIHWKEDSIEYDFLRKQILVECERFYSSWLDNNAYDSKKVKIMTALVYLNIAALHHYPYGLLLYALGKSMLYQTMKELDNTF